MTRTPLIAVLCATLVAVGAWAQTAAPLKLPLDNLGLEESLALMKLRFGWKLGCYSSFNVTRSRPKKRDLPQPTLDLIHQRNAFYIELYECGEAIFEEAVQRNAEQVKRIAAELHSARARSQGSLDALLFNVRSAARKAINRVYSAI